MNGRRRPGGRRGRRPRPPRRAARGGLLLAVIPGVVAAQEPVAPEAGAEQAVEVRFRPQAGSRVQRELARFLERERYALWTRDTVLARGDTVPGHLLVLEGAARIAGAVLGDIYVVDGDLFLRPGARIAGDIVALGGGFYSSGMATVDGRVTYRPNEVLRVVPEEGGWRILPVREALKPYQLPGLYGFRFPTYQRVDGWTFEWRGIARAPGFPGRPELGAAVRFRTEQDAFEGTLEQWWHPGPSLRVGVAGGRETRSNDAWIRDGFPNTLEFLLLGNDYRNYYRADHVALAVEVGRRAAWSGRLSLGWEEATSLEARERTVLFAGDSTRPNPAVDDGDIYGLTAVVDYEWRTAIRRRHLHLHLEAADRGVAGDFSFLLGEGQLFAREPVPADHAVEIMLVTRGDLGGSLPRQRWSALGGIGTLPTFPILGLRGERMFLAELTYLVPVRALDVPAVGPTEVLLRGAIGSAWSDGESLQAEQNLMAGVRFLFFEAALAVDPGGDDPETRFYVTGRWPRSMRGF